MAISKFLQTGHTYIGEAAAYLEARGVAANKDVSIVPYHCVNHGYLVKRGNLYEPWLPEGWAFRVRGPDGEYYDDRLLLRPCNKKEDIYRREKVNKGKEWDVVPVDVPKFLHIGPKGADLTHFASTLHELVNSPVLMFHEKFTSAALAIKHLGVPSLALSGCTNWSKEKSLRPSVRNVVELAQHGATIYVCFDADISTNADVNYAATQLRGWITGLRPDIRVVFPIVPEMADGSNGWDDWAVEQGPQVAEHWLALLQEQGYEITPAMPAGWLIETYGLAWKATKNDGIEIEHTSDNYLKLLNHPHWRDWARNIDGTIINAETLELRDEDNFLFEYEAWLQTNVFPGSGAKVSGRMVFAAVMRRLQIHRVSFPHLVLEAMDEVSEDDALAAANRWLTEATKVVAPMTHEENVATLLRICRDLVGLWAVDPDISPQWMLALVGPSGSGKSNWPERLCAFLNVDGPERPRWQPAEVPKTGSRSDPTEYKRIMRDNLVVMLDEYEPDDTIARGLEREFFSLSTKRQDMMRDPYSRKPKACTLRAGIILTTVDTNRRFIRSAKGAGAERRFIVWEMVGTVMGPDGKMTSNRPLMEELGAVLMRYGWQMWRDKVRGSANEFSTKYVHDYISDANVSGKVNMGGLRSVDALEDEFTKLGQQWAMRDGGKVRISDKMLANALCPGANLTRGDRKDIVLMAYECGAVDAPQSSGVTALANGKKARNVLEVADWPRFIEEMFARLR